MDKFLIDFQTQSEFNKIPSHGRYLTYGEFTIEPGDADTIRRLSNFFKQKLDFEKMNSGKQIRRGISRIQVRNKVEWDKELEVYRCTGGNSVRYWHERIKISFFRKLWEKFKGYRYKEVLNLEDIIYNIVPINTPFLVSIKRNKYGSETKRG